MLYSDKFNLALDFIFSVEGGYSNHKLDRGGKTNFGITQSTYDSYRKKLGKTNKNVKDITLDEVKQIYYSQYWCLSGADKVCDDAISLILFDSAVNHGVCVAKQLYKQSNNNKDVFLNLRRLKYKKIIEKNPSQKIFFNGWMNRLKKLENFILKHYK